MLELLVPKTEHKISIKRKRRSWFLRFFYAKKSKFFISCNVQWR